MTGVALVKKLDEEFRRLESPFTVTFDSPEDARALIFLAARLDDPAWRYRIGPAVVAIAEALAAEQKGGGS